MNQETIEHKLKKLYFRLVLLAFFLITGVYLIKNFISPSAEIAVHSKIWTVAIASLAGIFGLALPVFYRTYFIYKLKNQKHISTQLFLKFEKNILYIALTTPYFLILSLGLNLPERSHILIMLFSLYALYYYYPSAKKVAFEMKLFRINSNKPS